MCTATQVKVIQPSTLRKIRQRWNVLLPSILSFITKGITLHHDCIRVIAASFFSRNPPQPPHFHSHLRDQPEDWFTLRFYLKDTSIRRTLSLNPCVNLSQNTSLTPGNPELWLLAWLLTSLVNRKQVCVCLCLHLHPLINSPSTTDQTSLLLYPPSRPSLSLSPFVSLCVWWWCWIHTCSPFALSFTVTIS